MDSHTTAPTQTPSPSQPGEAHSTKSYVATWCFSYFLGTYGVDRFYRGFIGTGIVKLLTLGGFGIWYLIDLLMITFGKPLDKNGAVLEGYYENRKMMGIITLSLIAIQILATILVIIFVVPHLKTTPSTLTY